MKKIFLTAFCLLMAVGAVSAQPLSVIYETDYGNDADDALALDVICKLCDSKDFKLLGVSTHKKGINVCPAVDGSLNWYGYKNVPVAKSPSPVYRNDGNNYADSVFLARNAKGRKAFRPTQKGEYEDAVKFYRRVLAQQPDNSVAIISVGFATNLAKLLESQADEYSPLSGTELVAKKVKVLSTMMGTYRENPFCEFNVKGDVGAMRKVMDNWPTEIVQNPFEIGEAVRYAVADMRKNMSWAKPHPLVVATSGLNSDPNYRQCQFDVMSVIYLVHPELFNISQPGKININYKGINSFEPKAGGKHRYLTTTREQEAKLLTLIEELTSKKPKKIGK